MCDYDKDTGLLDKWHSELQAQFQVQTWKITTLTLNTEVQ